MHFCRFEELGIAPAALDAFQILLANIANGLINPDVLSDAVDRLRRDRPLHVLLQAEIKALGANRNRDVGRVERGQVILFENDHVRAHLRKRITTNHSNPRFSDTATHLLVPITPVQWSITTYRATAPIEIDCFRPGLRLDAPPIRRESPDWHVCEARNDILSATVLELDRPAWFLEIWQRPGLPYAWRFDANGRSVALSHAQHRTSRLALVLDLFRTTRFTEAEPALRTFLSAPQFDLRWKALQGLAALGVPDLPELLARSTQDAHSEVRAAARAALEKRKAR